MKHLHHTPPPNWDRTHIAYERRDVFSASCFFDVRFDNQHRNMTYRKSPLLANQAINWYWLQICGRRKWQAGKIGTTIEPIWR